MITGAPANTFRQPSFLQSKRRMGFRSKRAWQLGTSHQCVAGCTLSVHPCSGAGTQGSQCCSVPPQNPLTHRFCRAPLGARWSPHPGADPRNPKPLNRTDETGGSAGLRPLIAEHGAEVKQLNWQRALPHVVLKEGSHHRSSPFRAKRDAPRRPDL